MKARIPLTKEQKKIARQEIASILDREEQKRTKFSGNILIGLLLMKSG